MTVTPRPLDRVGSLKVKLGVLVAASIVAASGVTWYGLVVLGWLPRYSVPVAVLVGLAVTQVLAHGMTSPLRQMTAAAREMAAGRDPGPVRATSRDEVGELARAFNRMSADLLAEQARRRELLANVSHELRTPVAALRAQLENLVDGVRPPDAEALGEALATAARLGGLVHDLLGLARTEAGATPLRLEDVDVAALAAEVAAEVGTTRPAAAVEVDVPAGTVARADRARLHQVLVNLVDNAARHGRHVVVRGRALGDGGLVLDVCDDGPGIPDALRESVFERFERGAAPTGDGGTGLGLAIVRWAVGLHGGTVAVVPVAAGTTIRVELPGAPR